jgi:hypothetical protein
VKKTEDSAGRRVTQGGKTVRIRAVHQIQYRVDALVFFVAYQSRVTTRAAADPIQRL